LFWSTGSDGSCEDGWITYTDSCYLVKTIKETQSDAQADCETVGADLTSMNDAAEAAFIDSIV